MSDTKKLEDSTYGDLSAEVKESIEGIVKNEPADSELSDSLKKLQDALDAADKTSLVQGPALKVTEHTTLTEKYASMATKDALTRKTKALQVIDGVREVARCIYLCLRVRTDHIEDGVKEIVDDLNALTQAGLVHSFLAPPASIEFVRQFGQHPTSGVFAYPLIYSDKVEEALKLVNFSVSGDSTNVDPTLSIGQIDKILPDGDFMAEIRVTTAMNLISKPQDVEELVQKRIDEFLRFLPEGTTLVSKEKCGIDGLSIPYEVTFRNPFLQRVKRVELRQTRASAIVNDNFEQRTITTGIDFFDFDNRKLFT